jgi:hypothetical protein
VSRRGPTRTAPGAQKTTGLSVALNELAARVALLEAERNALIAETAEFREREVAIGRKLYRRGYRAGWAAAHRGAVPETAPERHARGWARRMLA